jgi:Mg-chelatase subunit ChlD
MKTEIIAIIDRSGSMMSIAADAIGGFNKFLADQKSVPGEARMSVVLFDHEYTPLYSGAPLVEAKPLTNETFVPRGNTAMLDAIGRTLNEQGARIAREQWAQKVIVCILTDGGENASREFTADKVKEMTKHCEAHGWSFVFLAANQDAFAAGSRYGISRQHTQSFAADAAGTQQAYASMSMTTRSLRSGPISESDARKLAEAVAELGKH